MQRATVTDASGDVQSTLGAPSYVDIVAGELALDRDHYTLKVRMASAPPRSLAEGRTLSVVSFIDVDGDGQIDYEMWANLSDDGWHSSYRYPDGARFGSASGVRSSASGATVVIDFPATHVARAAALRWSVGAEYGTFEQVASGSTAKDLAPDNGAVAFPG